MDYLLSFPYVSYARLIWYFFFQKSDSHWVRTTPQARCVKGSNISFGESQLTRRCITVHQTWQKWKLRRWSWEGAVRYASQVSTGAFVNDVTQVGERRFSHFRHTVYESMGKILISVWQRGRGVRWFINVCVWRHLWMVPTPSFIWWAREIRK